MFRLMILFLLAATLAGCSALNFKHPVAAEDLSKIKRIGVVSSLGDTFYGDSIGTTVFNNEHFTAALPEWGVSAYATAKKLEALKASNRYEAAELNLSEVGLKNPLIKENRLVWEAPRKQGFDKLLVLAASVSDNMRLFNPDFGLYQRSLLLTETWRCAYVGYVVSVYDVSTQKSIG